MLDKIKAVTGLPGRWASLALVMFVVVACGDSESTDTTDATTSGGGSMATGGAPGTGGAGATGGSGGTAEICDVVEHPSTSAFVLFTPGAGDPPAPAGGTIADGMYGLTSIQNYNGSATSGSQGIKETLVVSESGTRYARRRTTDSGGNDTGECGDLIVSGTSLTLHPTSWPDGLTPVGSDTEYFGYDTSGGGLTEHWYPGQQTTQVNVNTLAPVL